MSGDGDTGGDIPAEEERLLARVLASLAAHAAAAAARPPGTGTGPGPSPSPGQARAAAGAPQRRDYAEEIVAAERSQLLHTDARAA